MLLQGFSELEAELQERKAEPTGLIRLAATLQHAHIVPVLTAGDADGLPFFTMPWVDGASLRERGLG